MKYGVMAFAATAAAVAFAAPAADAQGLWWVEGDRYCSDFGNRSRNSAMCGTPKKGESEPKPTFRYEFNTPRIPLLDDEQARKENDPAPADRPGTAAPARGQQPPRPRQ
jgi:hypothetical protein